MFKKTWQMILAWLKGPDPLDAVEPRSPRPPRC